MGAHHEQGAAHVFVADLFCRLVEVHGVLQAPLVDHPLQHLPPFALSEDVELPVVERRVPLYDVPGADEAVEAFLIVQASHGDHPLAGYVRVVSRQVHRGVGDDLDVGQVAPIAPVLMGEDDELVEPSHDPLVLMCTPLVYQSQQSFPAVLQPEELAVVQLEHLLAAVLDVGDEGGFRGIERHDDVGLLLLEQCRQLALVLSPLAQVARDLDPCPFVVVVRIVDVQVGHPHVLRKGIERRTMVLVGGDDGDLPARELRQVGHLV